MTARHVELREELSGVGLVEDVDGAVIGQRHYYLAVWTLEKDGSNPAAQSIDGELELEPNEFSTLEGRSLMLTLEDGRRLRFFVSGPNGAIAALGELPEVK